MKKHFSTQSKATFISYLFNKTDLNIINNFLINGTLESTKSIKLLASETAQDIFLIANTNKLLDTSIYNSTPIYSTENLFYFLRNDNEIMEGKFEQLIHFFREKVGFHSFIEIDNKLNTFSFTENTVNITTPPKIVYENKSLREFILQTFKIVNGKFGDNFLIQNISNRETQINKQTFNTITIPKYFNMTRFFGVFDTEPNFEVLKTEKGAVRFYNENLRILNKEFIYLTNQWENKDSNSTNPKFSDFSNFIRDYSSNKYVVIFENDIFKLLETKTFFTNAQNLIFFGCPGTGKSHRVTEKVKKAGFTEYKVTFHPEYDYANFVGAYKPFTEADKRITYQFVQQAFIKAYVAAWKNLDKPYCLTIEEINRGNCAAIFGDIFQLLDRDKTGFSQYTIHADTDIANYLKQELSETEEYASRIQTLCTEREMADCENPYEILCLPPNLSLFATMNTSDQSLFPMDSAFKRRWQWQYVPIDYADAEQFTLKIGEKTYNWSNFLHTINNKIYNITESEDKQMGNRFVNPYETERILNGGDLEITTIKERIIDEEVFVNKVLFYLWFDIFKNEDNRNANYIFKNADNQLLKYVDLFLPNGKPNIEKVEQFLEYNKITTV